MGVVLQDTFLFDDTIRSNLSLKDEETSLDRLQRGRAARLHRRRHRGHARGLRHPAGRQREHPLRRPAAAPEPRAGAGAGPGRAPARRGDQRPRPRDRASGPSQPGGPGLHPGAHRTPPRDGPGRGPDPGARGGRIVQEGTFQELAASEGLFRPPRRGSRSPVARGTFRPAELGAARTGARTARPPGRVRRGGGGVAAAPSPRARGGAAGLPRGARPARLGGSAGRATGAGRDPGPPGLVDAEELALPRRAHAAPASRRDLGGARGPPRRRGADRGLRAVPRRCTVAGLAPFLAGYALDLSPSLPTARGSSIACRRWSAAAPDVVLLAPGQPAPAAARRWSSPGSPAWSWTWPCPIAPVPRCTSSPRASCW